MNLSSLSASKSFILPFKVTSNFNLGLFLKNEKSALKVKGGGSGGSGGGHSLRSHEARFVDVDEYVTYEYWSLDVEFLVCVASCILWSVCGQWLVYGVLAAPCLASNHSLLYASAAILAVNTVEAVVSMLILVMAKSLHDWNIKIHLLNGTIGAKLALVATNFGTAIWCMLTQTCGSWYSTQLHAYDESTDADGVGDGGGGNGYNVSGLAGASEFGDAVIDGFRYYDVKIVGLALVMASVAVSFGAMILLVKRNDIKMYVLWRLGLLDQYIDDQYNHVD